MKGQGVAPPGEENVLVDDQGERIPQKRRE